MLFYFPLKYCGNHERLNYRPEVLFVHIKNSQIFFRFLLQRFLMNRVSGVSFGLRRPEWFDVSTKFWLSVCRKFSIIHKRCCFSSLYV